MQLVSLIKLLQSLHHRWQCFREEVSQGLKCGAICGDFGPALQQIITDCLKKLTHTHNLAIQTVTLINELLNSYAQLCSNTVISFTKYRRFIMLCTHVSSFLLMLRTCFLLSATEPDEPFSQNLVWILCHWRPGKQVHFHCSQSTVTIWQTHEPTWWSDIIAMGVAC